MKNLIMITIALCLFSGFAVAQDSKNSKTGLTYKYVCQNINGTTEGMKQFSENMTATTTSNLNILKEISEK